MTQAPYPTVPTTSPLAIWSLALGILGFFCCPYFVVSTAAAVMGFIARQQIRGSNGAVKGEALANIGFVLGLMSIVVGAVVWILYVAGVTTFRLETG